VSGRPTLVLNDGGTASYAGGSGTTVLTFSYTVAAGQNTSSLAATAVNLNGGSIQNGAGTAANLSLAGITQTGPRIDSTTPGIASLLQSPSSGDLNAGKTVNFTLNLNETVTVAGTPTLVLNDGGTATYTGGSGTSALTFSYMVGAGQNTSSLAATAINLNGGSIQNGASTAANLSLNGVIQNGPQIDTTTPVIASVVESQTKGRLNVGKSVTFTLNLTESVMVTGTPTMTLNDGGTATYTGGSGTSALTFSYTVASKQNTSSLAATAINLNSGSIQNGAGTAANLSLTATSQVGRQIDTTNFYYTSLVPDDGTYGYRMGETINGVLGITPQDSVAEKISPTDLSLGRNLTLLGNYMASAFPSSISTYGSSATGDFAPSSSTHQPELTASHT
jgi:hypothetical protein